MSGYAVIITVDTEEEQEHLLDLLFVYTELAADDTAPTSQLQTALTNAIVEKVRKV